jgi:hypothetical protein
VHLITSFTSRSFVVRTCKNANNTSLILVYLSLCLHVPTRETENDFMSCDTGYKDILIKIRKQYQTHCGETYMDFLGYLESASRTIY